MTDDRCSNVESVGAELHQLSIGSVTHAPEDFAIQQCFDEARLAAAVRSGYHAATVGQLHLAVAQRPEALRGERPDPGYRTVTVTGGVSTEKSRTSTARTE